MTSNSRLKSTENSEAEESATGAKTSFNKGARVLPSKVRPVDVVA